MGPPQMVSYMQKAPKLLPPVSKTEITFTGMAAGETKVTIGNTTYNITVAKRVETLSMYVGEETSLRGYL